MIHISLCQQFAAATYTPTGSPLPPEPCWLGTVWPRRNGPVRNQAARQWRCTVDTGRSRTTGFDAARLGCDPSSSVCRRSDRRARSWVPGTSPDRWDRCPQIPTRSTSSHRLSPAHFSCRRHVSNSARPLLGKGVGGQSANKMLQGGVLWILEDLKKTFFH